MSEDHELVRRASALAGWLVGGVAAAAGLLGGVPEAAGALVGGFVTIANFRWLSWLAGLVYPADPAAVRRPGRARVWLALSCLRFGLVALALGGVVAAGWVGWAGLLGSLPALPAALVIAGLRGPHLHQAP